MSYTPTWLERREEDQLEYPYENAQPIPHLYTDPYNRPIGRLLKSIYKYANHAHQTGPLLPPPLPGVIPLLTRFCADSLTPQDLPELMGLMPRDPIKSRTILPPQALDNTDTEIARLLQDVRMHTQVIIIHHMGQNCWVIFLIMISKAVIELYTMGDIILNNLDPIVCKITRIFGRAIPDLRLAVRQRLQVPQSFPVDPIMMTFALSYSLHSHERYLDLTCNQIMLQKCRRVRPLIRAHDRFFGNFQLENSTKTSHPFIVTGQNTKDRLDNIIKAGWAVIDVDGDGNCGFYTFILGLENHGNYTYSYRFPNASYNPMSTNVEWQTKVLELRRRLKDQSQLLLRSEYPANNRTQDFWQYTSVYGGSEEDFDGLSGSFASDELEDYQYFDGSFGISLDDESDEAKESREFYQMDPSWAPHVFSFSFNLRVIVYSRISTYTKENKPRTSWSTSTFDYNQNVNDRVKVLPYLYRISDDDFKTKPTVEILFIHGYDKEGNKTPGHFQYLRRVLAHDCPVIPLTKPVSLRQHLNQKTSSSKRTLTTNANAKGKEHPTTPTEQRIPASSPVLAEKPSEVLMPITAPGTTATPVQTAPPEETTTPADTIGIPVTLSPVVPHSQKKRGKRRFPSVETGIALRHSYKSIPIKKVRKTKSWLNEKRLIQRRLTMRYNQDKAVNKMATKLRYDSMKREFSRRDWDKTSQQFQKAVLVTDLDEFDDFLVNAAINFQDEWMGPNVGDASSNGTAPDYLNTKIPTLHQQLEKPYCFTYSLASALFYCDFKEESIELAKQADFFAGMPIDEAVAQLRAFMPNLVPLIGLATVYGIRTSRHNRFMREMTFDELYTDITPYPTLVIPRSTEDGIATHAFCVVDDLIFDSITPKALKLQPEAVKWIFNDVPMDIYIALRFNKKISPPGNKIKEVYNREVQYHW